MDQQTANANQLDAFSRYIAACKPILQQQYTQRLSSDLSQQQWQGCFERNVLAVLEGFYADALRQAQRMPFDASGYAINNGMSDLTRQVLTKFQGFIDEFLLFVVDKHRTSCALSNFPDEHKPDKDYVNDVRYAIAELWRNFAINLNSHFLEIPC